MRFLLKLFREEAEEGDKRRRRANMVRVGIKRRWWRRRTTPISQNQWGGFWGFRTLVWTGPNSKRDEQEWWIKREKEDVSKLSSSIIIIRLQLVKHIWSHMVRLWVQLYINSKLLFGSGGPINPTTLSLNTEVSIYISTVLSKRKCVKCYTYLISLFLLRKEKIKILIEWSTLQPTRFVNPAKRKTNKLNSLWRRPIALGSWFG